MIVLRQIIKVGEKMKEGLRKFKSLIFEKTKEIVTDYGKYIGSGIVVLTLFVICGTTLAGRVADSRMPSGIMMTVSTVADGKEPFAGNVFYANAYTYDEMIHYEENENAESIAKSESNIQEILSARQENRQKEAAKEVLAVERMGVGEVIAYDPSLSSPSSTVPAGSSAQYTYADANGSYKSLGMFELTAYCPCPICCGIYSNMTNPTTASGTRATQGRTIATDTSVIPFGSKVVINGKIYTAEDTGGAIKGNRIDIYFESHTEALYFGRQKAEVFLVQ